VSNIKSVSNLYWTHLQMNGVTKSFNSRVAKCDDSYLDLFELKIFQIIFKLQFDYVV
jgi:hypothetical protein